MKRMIVNKYGGPESLYRYKNHLLAKTKKLFNNSMGAEIYIYCAGRFGQVFAKMLANEGFKVKAILDINIDTHGLSSLGQNICSPNILCKVSKSRLKNSYILICNESKNIVSEIQGQLIHYGLNINQIKYSDLWF